MADKKLLEESTIRRFMKLANISSEGSSLLSEGKKNGAAGPNRGGNARMGGNKFKGVKGLKERVEEEGYEEEGKHYEEEGYEEEGSHYEEEGKHYEEEGYEEEGYEEEAMEEVEGEDPMDVEDVGGEDAGGEDAGGDGNRAADLMKQIAELVTELGQQAGATESVVATEDNEEMPDEEMPEEEPMGGEEPAGELEESIELVDDSLIERLVNRVSQRLVREAKMKKENMGKGKEDENHTKHPKKKHPLKESEFGAHKPGNVYATHPVGDGGPFKGSAKAHTGPKKHKVKVHRHKAGN